MVATVTDRNRIANAVIQSREYRDEAARIRTACEMAKSAPPMNFQVQSTSLTPPHLSHDPNAYMTADNPMDHALQLRFGANTEQANKLGISNFHDYADYYFSIRGTSESGKLPDWGDGSADAAFFATVEPAAKLAMQQEVKPAASKNSMVRSIILSIVIGFVLAIFVYMIVGALFFWHGSVPDGIVYAIIIGSILAVFLINRLSKSAYGKRIAYLKSQPGYNEDPKQLLSELNALIAKAAPEIEKVRQSQIEKLPKLASKYEATARGLADNVGLMPAQYGHEHEIAKIIQDGYAETVTKALLFREDQRWKQSQEAIQLQQLDAVEQARNAAAVAAAAASYTAYKVRNL